MSQPVTEGINEARVSAWLGATVPGAKGPFSFELIAGGRSNLTFRVTGADATAYALRRPPLHHVLPTAHDMTREYRIMTALGSTAVPVPVTYGLCTDESVNERPFYVMEFVDGHILRDAAGATAAFDEAGRAQIAAELPATLAQLHEVDVDVVGLGDLSRHDGYIERQVRRWTQQYEATDAPEIDPDRLIEKVGADLRAHIPRQQGVAIVHGDYRLDNVVIGDDAKVKAILDWEICTLGDPLADVGMLLVYWIDSDEDSILGAAPTQAPGFPDKSFIKDAYAKASGLDLSDIGFYMGFAYWKLACILHGVYARYVAGAGAGDQGSVDAFPATVRRLAELADASMRES